jgi:succinate-semialdehyde dehydrogenase/glutarate-semialdehyde dehydrogenase
MINSAAIAKSERHVAEAAAKGARVVVGGRTLGVRFFEPTLLVEATSDMLLASEQTIGPVASLFRFRAEEEAIEIANDTPYGLAAYLYMRNVCFRVADALEVGMVGISVSYAGAPFGGVEESGLGREGSHHGIEEFLEIDTAFQRVVMSPVSYRQAISRNS